MARRLESMEASLEDSDEWDDWMHSEPRRPDGRPIVIAHYDGSWDSTDPDWEPTETYDISSFATLGYGALVNENGELGPSIDSQYYRGNNESEDFYSFCTTIGITEPGDEDDGCTVEKGAVMRSY